jgi:hypothetical protein
MIDLGELECASLSSREVGERIAERAMEAGGSPQPPMATITLTGADRRVFQSMDPAILQEARSRLLDLKISVRSDNAATPLLERRDLTGVNYTELFREYLKGRGLDDRRYRFVSGKGSEIIRKVMAGETGDEDAAQ